MNCLSATVAIILFAGACASPVPSAKVGKELEDHAVQLLKCRAEGREAGAYAAYADCKKDAGIE